MITKFFCDVKMTAVDAFCQFYQKLDASSVTALADVYANDVIFVDPVKQHQGLPALTAYFANLLENTENCVFDIKTVVTNDSATFVTWVMHFQHPKLASNNAISVSGVTELHIENDKVNYHRDYYDMGEMIYEHVPVLGGVVKWIKRRLVG